MSEPLKKQKKNLSVEDKSTWDSFTKTINRTKISEKDFVKIDYVREREDFNDNAIPSITKGNKTDFTEKSTIDKKVYHKLKNGRINPIRVLDLHGMTYNKAYITAKNFVTTAFGDGVRLILIVTGKGKNLDLSTSFFEENNSGILKKSLPEWLDSDSLRPLILNISIAHPTHGGKGAYYIYLRKNKHYRT